jgi:hypothetical protein
MRPGDMKKGPAATAYIEEFPSRCRMLARARGEKPHMIRNHKLPVSFFQLLKETRPVV